MIFSGSMENVSPRLLLTSWKVVKVSTCRNTVWFFLFTLMN